MIRALCREADWSSSLKLLIRHVTQLSHLFTDVLTSKVLQSKETPTGSYPFTGQEREERKKQLIICICRKNVMSVKCKTLGL